MQIASTHDEALNFINYQGNATKNHNFLFIHFYQNG